MVIDFKGIQEKIEYQFKNQDLLQQAFIRRSYSEEEGGENNEVLEFIGDKALDLAVIRIMMERFGKINNNEGYNEFGLERNYKFFNTNLDEGQFTDIKKDLVQKKALAHSMELLGFNKQIYMGLGDHNLHMNEKDSVKEDLFEAIIGAVALDSNWDMNKITNVVENMIDFEEYFENQEGSNYVGMLQTWSQKHDFGLPNYQYENEKEDDQYICHVEIINLVSSMGKGISKAKARMNAAKNLYAYLDKYGYLKGVFEDAIGIIDEENATRQFNELAQKKLITKSDYIFRKTYDTNGNPIWGCSCYIEELNSQLTEYGTTKKDCQKLLAISALRALLELEKKEVKQNE